MWGTVRTVTAFLLLGASSVFPAAASRRSRPPAVRIEARRFEFVPDTLNLKKGKTITLRLTSRDVEHGLRIPGLGLDVVIPAGATTDVTLTPRQPGTFAGKCDIYCGADHHTMTLTIEVRP